MNKRPKQLKIKMLTGERWYGGDVMNGNDMPYGKDSQFHCRVIEKRGGHNQVSSLLLSNLGRLIYGGEFSFKISKGVITLLFHGEKPNVIKCGNTLKDAYKKASEVVFPTDKKVPPHEFFTSIQFNDWMEVLFDQTQENVLNYAENIKKNGYPCSLLMIDDKWMDYYGKFEFHSGRFPDPKGMLDKLHEMGFKVILWETPFITPDMVEWKRLHAKGFLVKKKDGWPSIKWWWNGYSAVLDMTNPGAVAWLKEQNDKLIAMGVDGFKFDAGDMGYYDDDDVTFEPVTPAGHCKKWCEFGLNYPYNEYRAAYNIGGKSLLQRQNDKDHVWGRSGLGDIIPNMICQCMMGYNYSCPDMVGGGHIGGCDNISEELFVRYAAASALMPMMQFSISPWRVLSKEGNQLCLKFAKLHVEFGDYIYSLVKKCAETGEPICRPLEYDFPNEGFIDEKSAFMLGEKYLVCPVTVEGQFKKTIKLPSGTWKYFDGREFEGGKSYEFDTPLDVLPYFCKIN